MYELRVVAGPDHAFFLLIHIFLVVAWLGIDVGVFSSSFFLRNPGYSIQERLMIGKLAAILDMGPRASLLLMYPVGAWLSWSGKWGFQHNIGPLSPVAQLVLITLAFFIWEICVWIQFWGHRKILAGTAGDSLQRFLHRYRKWDIYARWVLGGLLILDGVSALFGRGFIQQPWLAWKILLFGLIVYQGIGIRWAADSWPAAIRDIVDNGSTPEREAVLNNAMLRAYPFVLVLWGLIIIISILGVVK